MNKIRTLLVTVMLGFLSLAYGESNSGDSIPIKQLVNEYAEQNQVNFVLSSEIVGKATLSGVSIENISSEDFIKILKQSGIVAIQKNEIVHLYTDYEVENSGKGFGPKWRG